jgi:hypothetical protein
VNWVLIPTATLAVGGAMAIEISSGCPAWSPPQLATRPRQPRSKAPTISLIFAAKRRAKEEFMQHIPIVCVIEQASLGFACLPHRRPESVDEGILLRMLRQPLMQVHLRRSRRETPFTARPGPNIPYEVTYQILMQMQNLRNSPPIALARALFRNALNRDRRMDQIPFDTARCPPHRLTGRAGAQTPAMRSL